MKRGNAAGIEGLWCTDVCRSKQTYENLIKEIFGDDKNPKSVLNFIGPETFAITLSSTSFKTKILPTIDIFTKLSLS